MPEALRMRKAERLAANFNARASSRMFAARGPFRQSRRAACPPRVFFEECVREGGDAAALKAAAARDRQADAAAREALADKAERRGWVQWPTEGKWQTVRWGASHARLAAQSLRRVRMQRAAAGGEGVTALPGQATCAVCLDEMNGSECRTLACGHLFHGRCIGAWLKLNPQCPLCKQHVPRGLRAPLTRRDARVSLALNTLRQERGRRAATAAPS